MSEPSTDGVGGIGSTITTGPECRIKIVTIHPDGTQTAEYVTRDELNKIMGSLGFSGGGVFITEEIEKDSP